MTLKRLSPIREVRNADDEITCRCIVYSAESTPVLTLTGFEIPIMADSAPTVEDAVALADARAEIRKQEIYADAIARSFTTDDTYEEVTL